MALTDKQTAFVREYPKDYNATQAAIRAGYSPNSARQAGAENLSKPVIRDALAELQAEARTEAVLTARELQEWWSSLIQGQDPDARVTDRLKASELLGKAHAMFTDKTENTGEMTIRVIREG